MIFCSSCQQNIRIRAAVRLSRDSLAEGQEKRLTPSKWSLRRSKTKKVSETQDCDDSIFDSDLCSRCEEVLQKHWEKHYDWFLNVLRPRRVPAAQAACPVALPHKFTLTWSYQELFFALPYQAAFILGTSCPVLMCILGFLRTNLIFPGI
jgi:hypothetical protein